MGGVHAAGSDGNDFKFREVVVDHYQLSSTNKQRLKIICGIHFSLWFFMLFRLSTSIADAFDMAAPIDSSLPQARLWEYLWLANIIPVIMGLLSIGKNNVRLIQQYFCGTLLLGVLPCLIGIVENSGEMINFIKTRKSDETFHGQPTIIGFAVFIAIALQIHTFSLSFSWNLWNAWTKTKSSKKR